MIGAGKEITEEAGAAAETDKGTAGEAEAMVVVAAQKVLAVAARRSDRWDGAGAFSMALAPHFLVRKLSTLIKSQCILYIHATSERTLGL